MADHQPKVTITWDPEAHEHIATWSCKYGKSGQVTGPTRAKAQRHAEKKHNLAHRE